MVDCGRTADKVLEASTDLETSGKVKTVLHGICHVVPYCFYLDDILTRQV